MATLISNKKSTYGSPYCYYTFTVSETSRTSSKVTLKFKVTAKLASSQSYIGTGCGLQAGVYVGGAWKNWTLKSTSESLEEWSGTAAHSKSASFSISADADLNKFTGVKVRVRRTDSLGTACTLNAVSVDSISIASSAKYTISYNLNGGTGSFPNQTKTYGTAITLHSSEPTRSETVEGATTTYKFNGWDTSSSATTVKYSKGAKYTSNSSAKLYAVWGSGTASTFDIVHIITNPITGDFYQVTKTKNKGSSIAIGSGVTVKAPPGFKLKNWNTAEDGSGTTYANGATYSTDNFLMVFTQWTQLTHTVTFNANGGSGAPSSVTKYGGTALMIPETEPTRSGYIFSHWNTASNGSGVSYYSSEPYTAEKDGGTVTLYAIWLENSIKIFNTGKCQAMNFIEEGSAPIFQTESVVIAKEIIEGSSPMIKSNGTMYFMEIIEK